MKALRDAGVPYLRGASDDTLRTLALGVRTGVRRTLSGPLEHAGDEANAVAFAPIGDDTDITLLPDNAEAFEHKCALVEGAAYTLDCALFYVADDRAGTRFADALARAARRGVRVRLAVDAHATQEKQFGPFGFGVSPRGALALLGRLRDAGVDVHEVGSDRFCMHRKFLLADGEHVVLGGRNVADHYVAPGWRDLELAIRGPFVRALEPAAAATFDAPTANGPAAPGVVLGVPGARGRAFARAFEQLALRARATIDIEHAYVLAHPWLCASLRAAVRRGVRVRLLTNSADSNDLPFMNWRVAVTLDELLAAGVEIHRRGARGETLHTKLVVGDERMVLFGSTNLDYYSPIYCSELDVALESAALGAALARVVDQGIRQASTQPVERGGPGYRALVREQQPWSVSRAFDLLLRDIQ